jgi:hypothetical protein
VAPAAAAVTTYSPYSTVNTYTASSITSSTTNDKTLDNKHTIVDSTIIKPSVTNITGFDYSYKPPTIPLYSSIDKTTEKTEVKTETKRDRPEFARKLSDADIVFGAKPAAPTDPSFKTAGYARNRSNSSFTSTSTDSDYIYGSRDARRDNSFQKSLSVSSDKDGDFSHDPGILATRSGISNDAFSDYDSPLKTTSSSISKPWSNNDDDFDLK